MFLIFLFGAAVGSFLNVVADRYNTGLPFLKGRSICFSCGVQLANKDLLPIFSFLFLRGKCRYCNSKIPKTAFWVEIIMGILSVLAAFKSGLFSSNFFPIIHNSDFIIYFLNYLSLLSIFATILLVSIYDLRHFIIPDGMLVVLFVFSILHNSDFMLHNNFSLSFVTYHLLLIPVLSGLILALPFFIIFLVSKGKWFGFGDIKYLIVIGILLGLSGGLSATVLAFWIGAAFSLFVMGIGKIATKINLPTLKNNLTIKSEVPFGPFLSVGIILSLYFNLDLFHIYEFFGF